MNCVTKHFKIVDEEIKSVKECRLKKEFKSSEELPVTFKCRSGKEE